MEHIHKKGVSDILGLIKKAQELKLPPFFVVEHTSDFIAIACPEYRLLYLNQAGRELLGIGEAEDITQFSVEDLYSMESFHILRDDIMPIIAREGSWRGESKLLARSGQEIPVSKVIMTHRSIEGDIDFIAMVARDISDIKDREETIKHMNRALNVIKQCDQVIVRSRSEQELYTGICRTFIETGGYRMAWIGSAEANGLVRPVAHYGYEEGYLETVNIRWDDSELGRGPTGTAIRSGKPVRCDDMSVDMDFTPWRVEATKRGYASSIGLPLVDQGRPLGILNIYAGHHHAIDREEEGLLMELASDVAARIVSLRAQEELHRLQVAIQRSDNVVFMTDPNGMITFVNDAFTGLYGHQREDVVGKTTPRVLKSGALSAEDYRQFWQKLLQKERMRWEIMDKAKDGRLIPIDASAEPILDEDNNIVGFLGVQRDITERKTMEEQLRQNEHRLNEAQRIAHVGSWELDLVKNTLLWSDEIYRIFGIDKDKFGASYEAFLNAIHPDDRDRVNQAYTDSVARHIPYKIEHRLLTKDGQLKYVYESGETFYDKLDKPLRSVGTVQDISERKAMERHVQEVSDLRKKFIQIVSHQLRTPLNSIRWNLETLLEDKFGSLTEGQRQFVEVTHDANVDIINRINDLLIVMDIEEKHIAFMKEDISIDSLLSSVIGEFSKKAKARQIDFVYQQSAAPMVSLYADAVKIRLAFEKLIENAVTYTPEKGSITISLEVHDRRIQFKVVDTGIGIPAAEQAHIFKSFFRATNALLIQPDASGVGLAIAKYFVEQHGGIIGFNSEEGKGSMFWFELPIDGNELIK